MMGAMRKALFYGLPVALSLGCAVALPTNGTILRVRADVRADGPEFDPTDLSHIKKLAAIGDSYSAGIGAGDRLGTVFDLFVAESGEPPIQDVHEIYPVGINNIVSKTTPAAGIASHTRVLSTVILG